MVMENLAAVRQAGLKPAMVDLTPFALLRSAVHAGGFAMDSAATAIVDVGAQVTNIVVHQNGVPKFVRILLMGGADLTNALAERLGVPPEQAETVKQQFSGPGDLSNPLTNPGGRALEASSSALVEEIRGSLDYYRAAPGSVPISRLLLTGGSSRLDLLAQRLSDAIRVQVEPGGVVGKLGLGKTGLTEEQLRYIDPLATVSVGLALGVAS
jgi:type IV pilus assembly protein PilM